MQELLSMRLSIVILFAVFCGVLSAQQPQLFGPPKSEARFKSPSFAETFGAPVPSAAPRSALKSAPAPKTCAIPLLSAAAKNKVDFVIQRVAPKENVDPEMQVAHGMPACGAPPDASAAIALKAPPAGK